MQPTHITINELVNLNPSQYLLIDVRSPAEYEHAYIPNAVNIPIFNNEERATIGTAYKQQNRQVAIKLGLESFGPNMVAIINQVQHFITTLHKPEGQQIIVHCWRGGMRSSAVAWLLNFYGFNATIVIGGYKQYRNWVLNQFAIAYNFRVISGNTGSGKTEVLEALNAMGEPIVNLEKLAGHKGSAFGNIEGIPQPSQEYFENMLAHDLYNNKDKTIWIEDESQRIGHVNLPATLYAQKQNAPHYILAIAFAERLNYITTQYGKYPKQLLIDATLRITKRLGGLDAKNAIDFLQDDDIQNGFEILLQYYDRVYTKALNKKTTPHNLHITLPCNTVNDKENAQKLLTIINPTTTQWNN